MKRWFCCSKNQRQAKGESGIGTFLIHKMHLNLESWILVSLLSFLGVVSQICALLRVENLAAVNFLEKKFSTKQTGDSETNSIPSHLYLHPMHFLNF